MLKCTIFQHEWVFRDEGGVKRIFVGVGGGGNYSAERSTGILPLTLHSTRAVIKGINAHNPRNGN